MSVNQRGRTTVTHVPALGPVCWVVPRNLPIRPPEGYRWAGMPLHLKGLGGHHEGQEFSGEVCTQRGAPDVSAFLVVSSVLARLEVRSGPFAGTAHEVHPRVPLWLREAGELRAYIRGLQRWPGEAWVWPLTTR